MAMSAHLRGIRPLRRRTSRGLGKTSEGREEREIPDRELPARPAFRDGLTGACPWRSARENAGSALGLEGRGVLMRSPSRLIVELSALEPRNPREGKPVHGHLDCCPRSNPEHEASHRGVT
jgi:hypothetical protein